MASLLGRLDRLRVRIFFLMLTLGSLLASEGTRLLPTQMRAAVATIACHQANSRPRTDSEVVAGPSGVGNTHAAALPTDLDDDEDDDAETIAHDDLDPAVSPCIANVILAMDGDLQIALRSAPHPPRHIDRESAHPPRGPPSAVV